MPTNHLRHPMTEGLPQNPNYPPPIPQTWTKPRLPGNLVSPPRLSVWSRTLWPCPGSTGSPAVPILPGPSQRETGDGKRETICRPALSRLIPRATTEPVCGEGIPIPLCGTGWKSQPNKESTLMFPLVCVSAVLRWVFFHVDPVSPGLPGHRRCRTTQPSDPRARAAQDGLRLALPREWRSPEAHPLFDNQRVSPESSAAP